MKIRLYTQGLGCFEKDNKSIVINYDSFTITEDFYRTGEEPCVHLELDGEGDSQKKWRGYSRVELNEENLEFIVERLQKSLEHIREFKMQNS